MSAGVYVDIDSFLVPDAYSDPRTAFLPGAISSLATLARRSPTVLIGASENVAAASAMLGLLEKEGVLFRETIEPDQFLQALDGGRIDGGFVYAGEVLSERIETARGRVAIIEPMAVGWHEAAERFGLPDRTAAVRRETAETAIEVELNLDGRGRADISTGIGFFDHMLEQVARHSRMDLRLKADGDLHIDEHHTIEDVAIVLGTAFRNALGDKRGVERYSFVLPMDDALARVALDLSGRPWLVWDVEFRRENIGDMPTEMFRHFFKSFTDASESTLNVSCRGENEHHKIESIFKAFGRCIGDSIHRKAGDTSIPSTKGLL